MSHKEANRRWWLADPFDRVLYGQWAFLEAYAFLSSLRLCQVDLDAKRVANIAFYQFKVDIDRISSIVDDINKAKEIYVQAFIRAWYWIDEVSTI